MAKQAQNNPETVECPKCGHAVPISEALRHKLSEELSQEIELKEADLKKREGDVAKQEKAFEDRLKREVGAAVSEREVELEKREAEIVLEKKAVAKRVQEQLGKERTQIEADAKLQAEQAMSVEMRDAKARLKETEDKLRAAEEAELALRKRERELEDKERNAELDVARKLSAQKAEVEATVTKQITADYRLKELEKEKVIKDLQKALEDANRKAQQGSQQLQGEVQELDLEATFSEYFPQDHIRPVPKGVTGADFLQIVRTTSGTECGTILWESKRTKNWSEGWLTKLKDDQRAAKADIAAIITAVLPKDHPPSGYRDRVWIANYSSVLMLASALRSGLLQLASLKVAEAHRGEIGDMLVQYVTGPEFRNKVEALMDTYRDMKEGVEKEKRATIARWAKQEKQIDKLVAITAGTYGDLRGLVGASMQSIPTLEAEEDETAGLLEITEPKKQEEIDPEDMPF